MGCKSIGIELEMQNVELRRAQLDLEAVRNRYVNLYDFPPAGFCPQLLGHRFSPFTPRPWRDHPRRVSLSVDGFATVGLTS